MFIFQLTFAVGALTHLHQPLTEMILEPLAQSFQTARFYAGTPLIIERRTVTVLASITSNAMAGRAMYII